MNLQEQIRNLKVGDSVRVGPSLGAKGESPYSFGAPTICTVVTPSVLFHAIPCVEVSLFIDRVIVAKESIIEVLPAKAPDSIACGNCGTQCHALANNDAGAVCLKLDKVRRASGWADFTRNTGKDRRKFTGPLWQAPPLILGPGTRVEVTGYAMSDGLGCALYQNEQMTLKYAPSKYTGVCILNKNGIDWRTHVLNLVPVERRKGDRRKA